jgi:predicted Zn-dependent protease
MQDAGSIGILLCAVAALAGAGRTAVHDGDHEQITALTRAIERNPGNAELRLRRAELYRLHRQWDPALADLERAQVLDPRLDAVLLCGARVFLDAGQLESARRLLDRHVALHPEDPEPYLLRAQLGLRRGALEEAARDYDHALARLDPPEPDPYLARAEVLARLGPAGVERALAGLDAGLARLGPVAALELRAVELERERGRFDDALARLDGIAARSPRQERWLALRGEILLEAGRAAEALEAFGAARIALRSLPPRLRSPATIAELETTIDCRLAELGTRLAGPDVERGGRTATPPRQSP